MINDSDRVCIAEIDINSATFDSFEFFHRIVFGLDNCAPDVFLSAYIDDYCIQNFDFKFNSEMLAKKIINTGKAFYVSNNLIPPNSISDTTLLQQYGISHMKNGAWFTLHNECNRMNCDTTKKASLLIPQYMVINWSDLLLQKHLRVEDFDTVSIYYDKYSPADPTLIFSREISYEQLDILAQEYGDLLFQERYTTNNLFSFS